ncbi:unnamed protein product [Nippostrongylus brasiliensis]|uniref:Serine carboxypeptidase S28 n=1 Tax=Nippostrongylus brasiliensis TaxID=27835 RepID=A0A0N4Y2F4_NIPBR|nr:unnamed protein product [Nippostrongylus brasiliensis]
MSTQNLVYLSSAQALEDMAVFIRAMKKQFTQLYAVPWVTFGGSYSGALAAWARVKHPELVAMAVGSSGPVQAEVDFVGEPFKLENGKFWNLGLCEALDPTNAQQIETFWSTVYSPYMEVVQYSGDNAGLFNNLLTIKNAICRFHESSATSLTKLKQVNNYFNTLSGYTGCEDIDYQSFIDFMKDTTYGDAQEIRAWVWQTCTEFGYYQSTDSNTAGPFFGGKPSLPVKYVQSFTTWAQIHERTSGLRNPCTNIYGADYNSASVASAVANVNAYYGGRDNMNSSYILLPNGDIDPWHALGKLLSNNKKIIPVVINGTAHCADMYGPAANDLPTLTAARKTIFAQLKQWLDSY